MKKSKISFILILIMIVPLAHISGQHIIRGKVSDKATGEPLPYAHIYLPDLSKGTQSNEAGLYELGDLPTGKIKVQFSYLGYKTIMKEIIPEGDENQLDASLQPTAFSAEEVVISGGTYSTQHDNPIKIELIKSEEIENSTSLSLSETLTSIPGVDMIAKGPGVSKPVIRGLSMTNILLLNNGVKLENFQFSENHPFLLDEYGSGGIEVIKGPASLLYGSDAVGGVINVLKEKPAPEGKILGNFSQQYHTNTSGIVSSMGLKGSSGFVFWGIRGTVKSHEDYTDGKGVRVSNSRFNEQSLKASLGLNRSFGTFRLYYDYNRPKLGMTVPASVKLVDKNGRDNEFWYQDLTNHLISNRNTLFLGNYTLNLNIAYQMNNRKLQTDRSTPAFEMVDMDLNTLSYELKTQLPSGLHSEYIIGLQGANKSNRNHEAPNHVLPDADVNDYSAFGLMRYNFTDKLKSQAGLRYDFRKIDAESWQGSPKVSTEYGNISASAGATWEMMPRFLLRFNLASAYRTPNLAELTQDGMHGNRYEKGNPGLHSQRSYEADLSMHHHTDILLFDMAMFYNRINDYIYLAPGNELTPEGNLIYSYTQSNSRLYGGEISFNALPFPWLDAKATYAYLIGEQDNGERLPFIPQNKLNISLRLQKEELSFLKNNWFKIGGLYAAKQDHPAMFETKSDAYFLLDASLGTQIKWDRQMLKFSIHASNLLDEEYIDHLSTLKGLGFGNMGRNITFRIGIPFGIK